jgi:hypothetical protein
MRISLRSFAGAVAFATSISALNAMAASAFDWKLRKNHELHFSDQLANLRLRGIDKDRLQQALAAALSEWLVPDVFEPADSNAIALGVRIRVIRLSGGSPPAVLAQTGSLETGCSPVGNCPIWIFEKRGPEYVRILEAQGQTLQLRHRKKQPYPEVLIGGHASAFETELIVYRMRDGLYNPAECFYATYVATGPATSSRHPQVRACKK